jgi:hypothetical protein
MNTTSDYRSRLEQTMAQAAAALARLDATPDPADYADGTVFYVRRQFNRDGSCYSYAYIRANNGWYGTGSRREPMSDEDFRLTLMRDDIREISVATEWTLLAGEAEENGE